MYKRKKIKRGLIIFWTEKYNHKHGLKRNAAQPGGILTVCWWHVDGIFFRSTNSVVASMAYFSKKTVIKFTVEIIIKKHAILATSTTQLPRLLKIWETAKASAPCLSHPPKRESRLLLAASSFQCGHAGIAACGVRAAGPCQMQLEYNVFQNDYHIPQLTP